MLPGTQINYLKWKCFLKLFLWENPSQYFGLKLEDQETGPCVLGWDWPYPAAVSGLVSDLDLPRWVKVKTWGTVHWKNYSTAGWRRRPYQSAIKMGNSVWPSVAVLSNRLSCCFLRDEPAHWEIPPLIGMAGWSPSSSAARPLLLTTVLPCQAAAWVPLPNC